MLRSPKTAKRYCTKNWISDFKQKDMWGGQGYRTEQPPYQIYRSKP